MRFSTVFSVLACGAMALAAAVAPDALVKRGTDISSVISTLSGKCDTILPLLDTCGEAKCTESLVLEVVAAVDVATKACVGAEAALSVELAKAIADVIVKIVVKLNDHKSSCNGKCGDLSVYAKVDLCISALLKQLAVCISGIVAAIANLLISLVVTLKGLSLTLILSTCSLS